MPAQNGTGPEGNGPKTGRGMGRCGTGAAKNNNVGGTAPQGRGSGRGRRQQNGGQGRGLKHGGGNRSRQGNR